MSYHGGQIRWGGSATIGGVYRVSPEDHVQVGHCWMRGRLKDDDLCLCVAHSGDGFYTYMLMEFIANGYRAIPNSEFGAYQFHGDLLKIKISKSEFERLIKGDFIQKKESAMKRIQKVINEIVTEELLIA